MSKPEETLNRLLQTLMSIDEPTIPMRTYIECVEAKFAGRLETIGRLKSVQLGFDSPYRNIHIVQIEETGKPPSRHVFFDNLQRNRLWDETLQEWTKKKQRLEIEMRKELGKEAGKKAELMFPWGRITSQFREKEYSIFHDGAGGYYVNVPDGKLEVNASDVNLLRSMIECEELELLLDPTVIKKEPKIFGATLSKLVDLAGGPSGLSMDAFEKATEEVLVALFAPPLFKAALQARDEFNQKWGFLKEKDPDNYVKRAEEVKRELTKRFEAGEFQAKTSDYWYHEPEFKPEVVTAKGTMMV